MKWIYTPVREKRTTVELGTYDSVGILAEECEQGRTKEVIWISDVGTDWEAVSRLAELCTEGQLSPCHLLDVIEDFLKMGGISPDLWGR